MKWICLALVLLLSYNHSTAQRANERRERIKALKTAFITEELELTSQQAEQFWPVYYELEDELKVVRQKRRTGSTASMTEQETEAWIRQQLDLEAEQVAIKRRYVDKFASVLTWQQIAKLLKVENRFKQELLRRMKERRDGRGR